MSVPILIATLMRPEGDTGVQTHFRAFMEFLVERGEVAEVVTPFSSPAWQVYPVFGVRKLVDRMNKVASVWWYRHWHRKFLELALRRRLAGGQPCVIYAQCPPSAHAALAARVSPQQRVVMVTHFNVSQADEWAGKGAIAEGGSYFKIIRQFEARVLPQLDGLVFVSEFMRRELLARIPDIADVPYEVVPNFIRLPAETMGSEEFDADLITIGTLEARKNQRYALEVVAAAKQLGRRITLTLVGDGPDRERLLVLARDLGVAGEVRFAGYVPQAAALLSRHHACLHVANIENLPLTLIEALSRGLPVFAPAVGGVPEVFKNSVEGRFIPLDNAKDAAQMIIEWLDSPVAIERAGEAARARFIDRFEAGKVAARLQAFLTSASTIWFTSDAHPGRT